MGPTNEDELRAINLASDSDHTKTPSCVVETQAIHAFVNGVAHKVLCPSHKMKAKPNANPSEKAAQKGPISSQLPHKWKCRARL